MYEIHEDNLNTFETDCSDLVDMTTNSVHWPTFATEIKVFQRLNEDFENVNISHIFRSMNSQADALEKETRTKCYIFSHIDQTRSDGSAPWRISSSDHHLI